MKQILTFLVFLLGSFVAAIVTFTVPIFFIAACIKWINSGKNVFFKYCSLPATMVMRNTYEIIKYIDEK